ncbi:WYL domain-containing protein [Streptomyces sp. KS 21]|uniref:WYL domain-containing protein n=1 Tax=Streptomyces sp. KS 21 TaxID=2485150 RepID=UPI001062E8B6|nr:WYL domain-containing protein [Streptomyces sp. KS 21]TDU67844.1 WYL domain-containing protein [Streptomyces sp. KS 21]
MSNSMKITAGQTTTRTLTDLIRAMDGQRATTITYVDSKGDESVRTIEIHNILTTSKGGIIVRAMCRTRGEMRTFTLEQIKAYTVHRIRFVLAVPEENAADVAPLAHFVFTAQELVDLELERDYPAPKLKLAA